MSACHISLGSWASKRIRELRGRFCGWGSISPSRRRMRQIVDLGWGADGQREVALTMSPEELLEALRRLYADADGVLGGSPEEREARETEEACRRRDQFVLDTASSLLAELNAKGRESA